LRLQLFHPEVAAVSCEECKAWIYTSDWKRAKRGGKDVPRAPGLPTPCGSCPKKSPENAKRIELTTRNLALVRRWKQVRATGGACLSEVERADGWLMKMLSVIDEVFREYEADRERRNLIDLFRVAKGI